MTGYKSQNQLFGKLFYRYTAITIAIVLSLVSYFIYTTKLRIKDTNLDYMRRMSGEAADYIESCAGIVNNIHSDLYQAPGVLADLLKYFKSGEEEYQKYRLDAFMSSGALDYEGFDDFAGRMMKTYPEIVSIEFISYAKLQMTEFYPNKRIDTKGDAKVRLLQLEEGRLAGEGVLSFGREIRESSTLAGVGCMIVNFKTDKLRRIYSYDSIAELFVYNQAGTVIFLSDESLDTEHFFQANVQGKADHMLSAYTAATETKGYTVYSYLDRRRAAHLPFTLFLAIVAVGIGLIVLAEFLIRSYLMRLTVRLNGIIEGMNQVTCGNLEVKLSTEESGDELDVIAEHFNEMCMELKLYIQKSYLAEIEQKNAELEALQNQINPHFLYNTLEAIRMKAISNGDREVGKMLYTMSVIFRSQLKDDDIIPVVQEIHYCKKYLELFEYRYQGRFTSAVECPEELMNYPVMKFILQPIIENYFVHGIRAEQEGNFIRIWLEKEASALLIHVEDNGKGMTEEELQAKNKELSENKQTDKKSVGIVNVNCRIKAVYGDSCGVTLKKAGDSGLHVIVKVGLL